MKSFLALIFIFILSGCTTLTPSSPKAVVIYNQHQEQKISNNINIPKEIIYNKKVFKKRFENKDFAEYYLENDEDYGWKELLTISFFKDLHLDHLEKAIKNIHNEHNDSKSEFQRMGDMLLEISLFYPKDRIKFKSFEANYAIFMPKCNGVVSIRYGKNFNTSNNIDEIWEKWKKDIDELVVSYPRMECI